MKEDVSGQRQRRRRQAETPRRATISKSEFLLQVASELPPSIFLPEQSMALLFGRLETARRAVETARLRYTMDRLGLHYVPVPLKSFKCFPPPPRPNSIVSFLNRSGVFPELVDPQLAVAADNLMQAVQAVRHLNAAGKPPSRLLDALVGAAGISWEVAAKLLRKITGAVLDEIDIDCIQQARLFWELYGEGRARFVAMLELRSLPLWSGDWGLFSGTELEALLPRLKLADHYERQQFLTNYVRTHEGAVIDVYSATGRPLFQHPFFEKFNPLHFGRRERRQLELKRPSE